ncbi:MAG: nucleotidyltransferase domain-containing protein [Bacteroidales bacterium]|nr:nucleotidyltransferase domain-containing protein [Bacteroidales bacterium]
MFARVQRYLSQTPIVRAWVFGSFARGEENAESDLDLLVDYDKDAKLSLLTIVRYQLDLEKLIGREVDLVQNGFLKPFAQPSAERDKYLIYERQGE